MLPASFVYNLVSLKLVIVGYQHTTVGESYEIKMTKLTEDFGSPFVN